MIRDDKRDELQDEYGMPVERLMYHLYQEEGMSSGDIADELGEKRSTVKDWLRQSDIKMRSRNLSDLQKVLILAYIDAGIGAGAIANRVKCGEATVIRYRQRMKQDKEPIDLNGWVSKEEYELLVDIVEDAFVRESSARNETSQEGKQSS